MENAWVEAAEDDGQDRLWWYVEKCPCAENCSSSSWKKANCWSYESHDDALKTLKHHLKTSGLHAMSDEDATLALDHANVILEFETKVDRDHYRKQVAACKAETGCKGDTGGKGDLGNLGKGGKGGKSTPLGTIPKYKKAVGASVYSSRPRSPSGNRPRSRDISPSRKATRNEEGQSSQVEKLVESVAQLASLVTNSLSSASASTAGASSALASTSTVLAECTESVIVPRKQAQMLLESLGRAHLASTQCKMFCEAFANQFREEADVISKARGMLKTLIVMQSK